MASSATHAGSMENPQADDADPRKTSKRLEERSADIKLGIVLLVRRGLLGNVTGHSASHLLTSQARGRSQPSLHPVLLESLRFAWVT